LDDKNAWAIASRGETYRLISQYEAALTDFNRAIELNDKMDWAIASRGQTHQALGQYEAALADFNRAVELDDKNAWAIASCGKIRLLTGKYEQSLNDLNRALELKPGDDWFLYLRALIFLMMKIPERANADISLAISQAGYPEPPDWSRISNLALYRLVSGHDVESRELYQTLLKNQVPGPNFLEAANDLANLLLLLPDLESARIMEDILRQRAFNSETPIAPAG
jgi:tetratricopeptide (TPR) repeat protein